MLDLLSSIGNIIVSLVMLLTSSIFSLLNLVSNIPTYITFLTTSIGFLPTLIIPFAVATVSILVILFIVGR